jgi:hypothetical protein
MADLYVVFKNSHVFSFISPHYTVRLAPNDFGMQKSARSRGYIYDLIKDVSYFTSKMHLRVFQLGFHFFSTPAYPAYCLQNSL